MDTAVTVIIATHNRREQLDRGLAGLAAQSVSPDAMDVIVVDDGSSDGTHEWLETLRPPFALRSFRQTNQGAASARNRGLAVARGAIVVFLDDDVVPGPDLVRAHLDSHATEAGIAVVGPLTSPPGRRSPWVAWHQATLERRYQAMATGVVLPSFHEFWTGNASVPRRLTLDAGGFDPSFHTGEDVELGSRLMTMGARFRFNPAAHGIHHGAQSFDAWRRRFPAWARAEVAILRRLGEMERHARLATLWQDLHPLTRLAVRSCSGQRAAGRTMRLLLSAVIRSVGVAFPMSGASLAACGCLANLLYWDAAAAALTLDGERVPWARPLRAADTMP
jgi:GT2 family glycosyltransferase